MDELSKLFENLLGGISQDAPASIPPEGADPAEADAAPAAAAAEAASDAVETFAGAGSSLSGLGSLLGSFAPQKAPDSQKLQLLIALKPYLRPARREKLDRAESLIGTAYSVRAILHSLGGVIDV